MSSLVGWLNQPGIKQGIKECTGGLACMLGLVILVDMIEAKAKNKGPVDKAIVASARISVMLSAIVSPVSVRAVSFIAHHLCTAERLEKLFGPNTTFASNWKHPRHITTLVATGLAVPIVVRRCLWGAFKSKSNVRAQIFAIITFVTGRPCLHLANRVAHKIFSK